MSSMANAQVMSSAVGAPPSSNSASGLIGVETICVVDVREQTILDNGPTMLDDLDIGPCFSNSGANTSYQEQPSTGPGNVFQLKMASVGAGTGMDSALSSMGKDSSNRLFSRRPLSAAALKKHKEKLQQQRKLRLEEEKRKMKKEAEWNGRAGGLDTLSTAAPSSPTKNTALGSTTPLSKKLPPITNNGNHEPLPKGGVNRTNSAPVLKKKLDDRSSSPDKNDPST
uniref:Uncharacterized protein n=1 Tax=Globisporangium ultimum (strain ATCC 200006 / CBS 805.95 / DAOM BR144) TaxID=431595 RepID=K3WUW6_GLOUD